jgi:hypothetical protein
MLFVDVIGGLTQDEGHANGATKLTERLLAETDDYSALSVRIHFNPWYANWKHIARRRYDIKQMYPKERIGHVVCPFSYGGGHGMVKLANQLDQFGMKIHVAVPCDAIYRHMWMKWRSLYGDHSIKFPDNILSYHGYYQRKSRPWGIKPTGLAKELSWEELFVIHTEMDDQETWHLKCVEVVRDMAAKYVGGAANIPVGAPESEATVSRVVEAEQRRNDLA